MAGLDNVPQAPEDSGLPPAQAAAPKKKAAVPNQTGLNEWVNSPEFAASREKQIQDYYNTQLARIKAKENSLSERWGLADIRASYGAPSAEAQNQRMRMRQEEKASDRAREREVFEGMGNLAQMKQAVQTRREFNATMEQSQLYKDAAARATDPKQKATLERLADQFNRKAQYLDPQTYAAFNEQRLANLKSVAPESALVDVGGAKPEIVAQGGIKTSDQIAGSTAGYNTGVNPVAGRTTGVTLGGGPTTTAPAGGGGGARPAAAAAGASGIAPAPARPGGAAPGAAATPAGQSVDRLAAIDNYRPTSTPVINTLPPAERNKMIGNKVKDFQSANEQIGNYARMDQVISGILQHPEALSMATGQTGWLTKFGSPQARNAALQIENLREMSSIEGLKKLRASGTAPGSITEAEWPRFESYFVNLKNAQSPEEMRKQLGLLRTALAEQAVQSRQGYEDNYGADNRFDASLNKFRKNPEGKEAKAAAPKSGGTKPKVKPEDDPLGLFK